MATAKRLYLYGVSAAGMGMLVSAAAVLLHLLLNKAGIGPQIVGSSTTIGNADRDLLSIAIPVGIIGLILWLTHWGALERIVHRADETAAAERASIVRSVFFVAVLSTALLAVAGLGVDLVTKSLSNIIDPIKASSSSYSYTTGLSSALVDDAWALAVIIVAFGAWAYHAWVRARDLRQGTFIGGAAAWISRFYLYGAALMGLRSLIVAVSAIIATFGGELFKEPTHSYVASSGNPTWYRPIIAALVSLVIWTIVWLIHWLYSNRLRSGRGTATEQNLAERSSRVRLAYIMSLVFIGAMTVISSVAMSLGFLFLKLLGYDMTSAMLGYYLVVPPLAAIPVALVWFLHRRRGIGESVQNFQAGISGRRIAGYLTAIAAIYALTSGAVSVLGSVFGEWFAVRGSGPSYPSSYTPAFDMWKYSFAIGLGALLVGIAFWVWPWFTSQRRRRAEGEIGSSSRSYYLYSIAGTSILILAGSLSWILYRYLRVAFGLPETNLGPEISLTLALALVAALFFVYHGLVLRGDSKPRQYQPAGQPVWPGYPGPGAYPPPYAPQGYAPAGPAFAPPGAYQPAPPAWQPAPVPPAAPAPVAPPAAPAAPEVAPPSDAKPEAGA